MKTMIGAAFAALSLAVALPALAEQSTQTSTEARAAAAAAQANAAGRNGQTAPPRQAAQQGQGMMGQGMMGKGTSMDMSQMMASCPCCRKAMQGQAPKAS